MYLLHDSKSLCLLSPTHYILDKKAVHFMTLLLAGTFLVV
jgi:hypothetical protein